MRFNRLFCIFVVAVTFLSFVESRIIVDSSTKSPLWNQRSTTSTAPVTTTKKVIDDGKYRRNSWRTTARPDNTTTTTTTESNSKWKTARLTQTPTESNNTSGVVLVKRAPQTVRYEYWHVFRIEPRNIEDLSAIKPFEENRTHIVFLDPVFYGNQQIQALVSPDMTEAFKSALNTARIRYKITSTNAQESLDRSPTAMSIDANDEISFRYRWEQYYTLETTYDWMRSIAARFSEVATLFTLGQSFEGREILGIRISSNGNESNRAIFIEGGMHGREWISPATATFIIQQLITNQESRMKNISESFDWYIVPHANPDSYEYTTTTDRLWRKTRTPYGNGCFGADPGRNFDFHWNEIGTGGECNERYAGPKAFSEVETKALSDFLTSIRSRLMLYISIGAYGQYLLVPYGHTVDVPQNYNELRRVVDESLVAISQRYGTEYVGGTINNILFPSSGSSIEWVHGALGVGHTYDFELRPVGNIDWDGFLLPANQILPTAEETLDAILAMVNAVRR